MSSRLLPLILSADAETRDSALDEVCAGLDAAALLAECRELDAFRRKSPNLYERVRALFFLAGIYRYHLPERLPAGKASTIPFPGFAHLLSRRFEEAIDVFLAAERDAGPADGLCSAL